MNTSSHDYPLPGKPVRYVKRRLLFAALLAIGYVPVGLAQCELPTSIKSSALPPEKLALREAIYKKLCNEHNGDLMDAEHTSISPRLKLPRARMSDEFSTTEDMSSELQHVKKPVILAVVVEPSGRLSWVGLLDSSGDKEIDRPPQK